MSQPSSSSSQKGQNRGRRSRRPSRRPSSRRRGSSSNKNNGAQETAEGRREESGGGGGGGSGSGGGGGGGGRRSGPGNRPQRGRRSNKKGRGGGGHKPHDPRSSKGSRNGAPRNKNRQQRGRSGGRNERPPQPTEAYEGVLEIMKDGSGFLRRLKNDYSIREDDVFVPTSLVRRNKLQTGYNIVGKGGMDTRRNRPTLVEIETVEGYPLGAPEMSGLKDFRDLTSLDPEEKLEVAHDTMNPSLRLLDLLTPIGKGQRGLIVAPPRTGKTMLLQAIADSVVRNHEEVHLICVLVDERPEEATEWKRSISRGEVLTSTSDEGAANHVHMTELAMERAKRLVELKKDVVVVLDSLTRLARAYNLETKNSGRTLSGGIDAKTLGRPKTLFGGARNLEEGGSLTIIASALIDTGSRMDQVIFEEFKGTGNMELVLSRKLADMRIFPAFDIHLSGTRKEEKLIGPEYLNSVWALRRVLQSVDPVEGMRILIKKIGETKSNEQFLMSFSPDSVG